MTNRDNLTLTVSNERHAARAGTKLMISRKARLQWRLFLSYVIIVVFCLVSAWILASDVLRQIYYEETRSNLLIRAELLDKIISKPLSRENADSINKICRDISGNINTRITVILPDGSVIADTDEAYEVMDNHCDRPEIIEALQGIPGVVTRHSETLKKELMYVAIPCRYNGSIGGVVRTSMPVAMIDKVLNRFKNRIALIVSLIALTAAFASYLISKWINRPIGEMIKGVSQFARGNLFYRIPLRSSDELGTLTESINDMAAQLDERVREITDQQSELEAILSGMVAAIIVVDNDLSIIEHNQAAEIFFDDGVKEAKGRSMGEIIHNTKIFTFAKNTLTCDSLLEDDITLHSGDTIILHAHGTRYLNASGQQIGAIIVLNDITRIKRLENMRREFVANVSHELKTPITSIIGFVETLNDGAINDVKNREQFLAIILKHAKRLNAIIEDLLSISRIEQDTERGIIELEKNRLGAILDNAIMLCDNEAKNKNISIMLDREDFIVNSNAPLLEQAIVNLIDNAIKYSDPDTKIFVTALKAGDFVAIAVRDNGFGIPKESLGRIFERFYRVDKGRSRASGGTGLGLSIVKHIVNAHNGSVDVESIPNQGSTFTIRLPS